MADRQESIVNGVQDRVLSEQVPPGAVESDTYGHMSIALADERCPSEEHRHARGVSKSKGLLTGESESVSPIHKPNRTCGNDLTSKQTQTEYVSGSDVVSSEILRNSDLAHSPAFLPQFTQAGTVPSHINEDGGEFCHRAAIDDATDAADNFANEQCRQRSEVAFRQISKQAGQETSPNWPAHCTPTESSDELYRTSVEHESRPTGTTVPVCNETVPTEGPRHNGSTVLDRTDLKLYWDKETDCPDIIGLDHCRTVQQFFRMIEQRMPKPYKNKTLVAAKVRLAHSDDRNEGFRGDLNCRLPRPGDQGARGFSMMMETLQSQEPSVKPVMEVTFEYE